MAVARRLGDPREAGGLPSVGGSTPDEAEPEAGPEAEPAAGAELAAVLAADPDRTKLVEGRDVCVDFMPFDQTEAARKIDQLLRDAQPAEVDDLPSRMTALQLRDMAVSASTLLVLELAAIELDFRYRTTHGDEQAAAAAAYFAGDGAPDEETQRALRDWAMDEFTDESAARYAPASDWDAGDVFVVGVGACSGDSRTEYVDALAALRGSEAAPEARAASVARVAVLGAPDDLAAKFVAHMQGLPDAAAFVGTAAAV